MSVEKAWEEIARQIKKTDSLILRVVIAFGLVLLGTVVLIFVPYVGLPIMFAGIILMTIVVRSSRNTVDNSDMIFQKYILPVWLKELFEDIEFDSKDAYTVKELKPLGYWDEDWDEIYCARAFHGIYKGCRIRGAEVAAYHMPEKDEKQGKYDYELDEPIYSFRGRIIEIWCKDLSERELLPGMRIVYDGEKNIILYDLNSENGVYAYWLLGPSADNMNVTSLHEKAMADMKFLTELL